MPSSFSPNLRIELIGAGEQAGTWGSTTNTNLGTLVEDAISGYDTVSVTTANQALTYADGAADQARNAMIELTTTTGAAFAVYAPPSPKTYVIYNASAHTATIYNSTVVGNTTAAGTGVAVPAGRRLFVISNGTNFSLITAPASSANVANTLVERDGSGNFAAGVITAALTGNVTGDVTGNLNGNLTAAAPTAATQSFGNSTTAVATTAFVQAALRALHPVGSIYINATNATNPGTLLGFGTWTAFGAGRVPVGFDASDSSFNSAEETGGSKNAIVVSHTHSVTDPGHFHNTETILRANYDPSGGANGYGQDSPTGTGPDVASETASTGITINSAGSSGTNANLQPYITVYMWKRTA
jgi:hypothetical protein